MKKRNIYLDNLIQNLNSCIAALIIVTILDFTKQTQMYVYKGRLEQLIDVARSIKETDIGFENTKTLFTLLILKTQLNIDINNKGL